MPVLDRASAEAILSKTPPSQYIAEYRQQFARQQDTYGADLLQPLDERVLGYLLVRHVDGFRFATPVGIAKALAKKVSSVRNSLARLRRHHLLPFEVRL